MTLDVFLLFMQQGIASGLVTGSVYALLAIAIVIVFRTTDVANFAEGEVYMASAYLAFFLIAIIALPYWVAVPATVLAIFAGDRAVPAGGPHAGSGREGRRRQPRHRNARPFLRPQGHRARDRLRRHAAILPVGTCPEGSVTLWHASLTYLDLAIFAAALAVMALFFWMFNYTKTGRAMRAVGMNRRAAQLVGINLGHVQMLVWGLSGAISAVAAILIAPKLLMTAEMGVVVTLAFAAAIVGGFTSLPGAVVGGLIIGITENLVGLFVSSRAINVAPFVVIMLVLIFKPQGLFGGKLRVRKV